MTIETNRVRHTPGPWVWVPSDGHVIAGDEQEWEIIANVPNPDNGPVLAAAPEMADAGNTLAAYVYALFNPGEIPEHVKAAMRTFQAVS